MHPFGAGRRPGPTYLHKAVRELERRILVFMLFDGDADHASLVWYRYNDNNELLARHYSDDPAGIELCHRHRDLAVAHAVPHAEFIQGVNLA